MTVERIYSAEIANAIISFLKEENWKFTFNRENGQFTFGVNLNNKIRAINYQITLYEKDFVVQAFPSIGVDSSDKKMIATMSEFVCCANCGMRNGNFIFDVRDGGIGFKSFVDCAGTIPTKNIIENSILIPALSFERYGSGILEIIFGNVTAMDAFAKCWNNG